MLSQAQQMMWRQREITADFVLVTADDGARFPVHRDVWTATSAMARAKLCGGFREANNSSEMTVDGDAAAWRLIVSYMYTQTWFKLSPRVQAAVMRRVRVLADFYGMPDAMLRDIATSLASGARQAI